MRRSSSPALAALLLAFALACGRPPEAEVPRASGFVEATDVRVASRVPGRITDVRAVEGRRVEAGETLVTISPAEIDLALERARAERDQAEAQLRLLQAGTRVEEVRQAEAQVAAAASDRAAAVAEVSAARADEARFDQLLRNRAGTEKQRDDARARRELADARLAAADDRHRAAAATLSRLEAGARPEELAAARARVAAVAAEIASLEHDRADTTVVAPSAGIVSSRLVEPGELAGAGQPLVVLIDLDAAWVNAFVEEPLVPTLRIEGPASITTDAGDRLSGRISFIASRAEFTPRNVQTTSERAKLVYRVKVRVDNRQGVLKPGMPVEVQFEDTGR